VRGDSAVALAHDLGGHRTSIPLRYPVEGRDSRGGDSDGRICALEEDV
jgi:hypothetical protein